MKMTKWEQIVANNRRRDRELEVAGYESCGYCESFSNYVYPGRRKSKAEPEYDGYSLEYLAYN
ncbi:hypothetical protein IJN73_01410 [Candidatus Saccharibacteria bacterium]|nr:hypothetical protein [Candidatus Saccharibacteria bacterium]